MSSIRGYFDAFHRFTNKESSIQLKLRALEKMYDNLNTGTSKENIYLAGLEKDSDLSKGRIETLSRKKASSRNISFMKELNIAETQLRIMACFCPTDGYLQACKRKYLKGKPQMICDSKTGQQDKASTKKKHAV